MYFRSALNGFENSTNDVKSFCESLRMNDYGKVKTASELTEPYTDELAEAEIRIIDPILLETKEKSPFQLSEASHKDWITAYKRTQDDPTDNYMPLVNIAEQEMLANRFWNTYTRLKHLKRFAKHEETNFSSYTRG